MVRNVGAWCLGAVVVLSACEGAPGADGGAPDGATSSDGGTPADAGDPDAGGPVVCTPDCTDAQVCERGTCVSRSIALQWLAPGDGTFVDAGLVRLAAQLVAAPGRPPDEVASLAAQLQGPSGSATQQVTLVSDGGAFAGEVALARGQWVATVTRGVLTARQSFWAGPLPLALRVTLGARPDAGVPSTAFEPFDPVRPERYRRDLVVPLRVSSDTGELDAASVSVRMQSGAEEVTLPGITCPPELACGAGACACFAADLASLRLDALAGDYALAVAAADVYGLQFQDSSPGVGSRVPSIPVTRWGWRARFFTPMGTSPLRGPFVAVDGAGRILVSASQDARAVTACFSAAGAPCWQAPTRLEAPPLVSSWPDAGQVAHLPLAEGPGVLAVDTASGAQVAQPPVTGFAVVGYPLSLLDEGADGGWPLVGGLRHDGDPAAQALFAWGPERWTTASPGANSGTPLSVTGAGPRLIWSAQWPGGASVTLREELDGGTWDGLSARVGAGLGARHLVPVSGAVVGARQAAAPGAWFAWDLESDAGWSLSTDAGVDALPFVMPNEGELIGARYRGATTATELVRLPLDGGAPAASQPLPAPSYGAPALGADGRVYVLDVSGALRVLNGQTLVSQWSTTFPSERFERAALLDCARDEAGAARAGRPGRLLVAGNSGRVYSLVVDARGVDPAAHWPLVFHDAANTNNSATSLADFTCP